MGGSKEESAVDPDSLRETGLRNKRRHYFWIAMISGSVVMALVAGEILARFFVSLAPPLQIGGNAFSQREHLAAFQSHPELVWRLRRNVMFPEDHPALPGLVSNEQGLRQAQSIGTTKAQDELRILFIGDSVTFGWGVRHDETFPARVEWILRERFPEVRTLSINAGVPAYSLFQGWRFLMTEGLDYEPDVVVLGSFGHVDSNAWLGISDLEQFEHWRAAQPAEWLRWSSIAQLLTPVFRRPQYPQTTNLKRPRLTRSEFRDVLERILKLTQQQHTQLLVVVPCHVNNINGLVPPGTWGPYQKVLGEFAQSLRLGPFPDPALVDGAALLFHLTSQHDRSELLFDLIHPTPIFHAALAEEIADRLGTWIESQIRFGRFRASAP